MFNKNYLFATAGALTVMAGSPVMSNDQATQILEEYFDTFRSTPMELSVGDKEDASRYTQWNNIILKSSDGKAKVVVPWIKVSKKLLGGFELTYAEEINGTIQSPDSEAMNAIRFIVESDGAIVNIGGKEGAREYDSSFDEVTFRTLNNNVVSIQAKMTDATGTQLLESGDTGRSVGSFDVKKMVIDYSFEMDGQSMKSSSKVDGFTGNFEMPFYKDFDAENPADFFDPSRNLFLKYTIGSGNTQISSGTPAGPVDVNATFGSGTGTFGITDSIATMIGTTKDIAYDVTATGLGLPPMKVSVSEATANIGVPLDNVEESKPADYKIALSGMKLSDQVWAMFDPKALLPRDEINLDIDVSAQLRWLKKIAEIDVKDQTQAPPIAIESAEIKAFNLNIAGAELQTTGAMLVDNNQFPPIPDGTVNVSLKGAQGLLGKLTEIGLLQMQHAAMIQGMSSAFFKPGDGVDHLVSVIEMTKDGHITANGIPLK